MRCFNRITVLLVSAVLLLLPAGLFPQSSDGENSWDSGVPVDLRRPRRGESPRYPRDLVIGELGAGRAPEGAYFFAGELLNALVLEFRDAPVLARLGESQLEDFWKELKPIGPQKFRIGGGREEADGSFSFLIRFLGREQGISGELYLRQDGEQWLFDDMILEEAADLVKEGERYRYDFSPYERFY